MSRAKNRYQAERWLLTAEEDLEAARLLMAGGMYPQCCFLTQQSAEKAVKAMWYMLDAEPWGHSVQRLLEEFPRKRAVSERWIEKAALLDKFYIPTRYPNGLPDLTPGQVYRLKDAESGLEAADTLLKQCRAFVENESKNPGPEDA
jgi:HEPN domain-containing protein